MADAQEVSGWDKFNNLTQSVTAGLMASTIVVGGFLGAAMLGPAAPVALMAGAAMIAGTLTANVMHKHKSKQSNEALSNAANAAPDSPSASPEMTPPQPERVQDRSVSVPERGATVAPPTQSAQKVAANGQVKDAVNTLKSVVAPSSSPPPSAGQAPQTPPQGRPAPGGPGRG
ncbi:MAG: hypothetical protein MK052_09865 [Alphaproteobacteria bacterium]|nr:hypothetical protein [Alphaproteobacteria bacterium]